MTSENKRVIIALGLVGVLCCVASALTLLAIGAVSRAVQQQVNLNPVDAEQVQKNIATFDIPADYESTAATIFFYDMVSLSPETNGYLPSITLVQYDGVTFLDNDKMEQQLREAAQQQGGQPGISVPIVGSFETMIRGEVTTVTVSEDSEMRQWTAVFEGNHGPAIFMAQGYISGWDEKLLMDFLKSIR